MKFTGSFLIPAPRLEVFERLNDPYFFTSCLEGVSNLEALDADHYTATLDTKVAFLAFRFDVAVTLVERVSPSRVVAKVEGSPRGMVGRMTSTAVADLEDAGDGRSTRVLYEMDVALAGKLGSIGQPVMRAKAAEMEAGFVAKVCAAFAPEADVVSPPLNQRRSFASFLKELFKGFALIGQGSGDTTRHPTGVEASAASSTGLDGEAKPPVRPRKASEGFELLRPTSLVEALHLLDSDDPAVRPMSGGTGLMLMMKSGVFQPTRLVDLTGIEPEHSAVEVDASGRLRIGGLVSLRRLELDPRIAEWSSVIPGAMPRVSNVRVRNVARVGGCLAHGDPHMDLPPMLAGLRAEAIVRGPAGERLVPVEALYSGYYQTVLGRGEIIAGVVLPPAEGWRTVYRKMTVRTHDDWPALSVAVSLLTDGPEVRDARVVISAATEKLTRLPAIEALLKGATLDDGLIRKAADGAMDIVETVEDAQGSAAYKKALVGVEVRRALAAAMIERELA